MTRRSELTTPGGIPLHALGQLSVLSEEEITQVVRQFDADPRVATVSVVSSPTSGFLRGTAPRGSVVLVRLDHEDLVGDFDPDELEAWSRNAIDRGLSHVWYLSSSPALSRIDEREPSLMDLREEQRLSSARFQARSERSSRTISIAVDASWLGPYETGAQVLTTAAVAALADVESVEAIYLKGIDNLPGYARHLSDHPKVGLGGESQADICWFPNQVDFRSRIAESRKWGKRVITTYLDLIAYDIPRYHASEDAWDSYRTLQRRTALSSDGITTISDDVARRLIAEVPLLDEERVKAIPLGLDHISSDGVPQEMPEELGETWARRSDRPFILVLGNDFLHKNRDFAVAVWKELLSSGVSCDLVLAGLHVRSSSSRLAEEQQLASHVDLRGQVFALDHVSTEAKTWLLAKASAVLYPSSAEGFGFVPYEAAALGTPSTFTRFGPLGELTQVADAPTTWRKAAYVSDLTALMTNPEAAAQRIATLRGVISDLTWQRYAHEFVDFMFTIKAMPIAVGGAVLAEIDREAVELNAVLASRTWRAIAPLRKWGRTLRGRGSN